MAYFVESRRPAVSRVVLDYLRVKPGPVNNVFVVKNCSRYSKDGIFAALHVIKKMLHSDFIYAVNHTREAQLVIRCTSPADAELLDSENVQFKFDHQLIKIYKLASISAVPQGEDTPAEAYMESFRARLEGNTLLGYPAGYGGDSENLESHINPEMSRSTMRILGIEEGPVENIIKVIIKFSMSPADFIYALRAVPVLARDYTYAVDQDGSMYLNFDRARDTEVLVAAHFLLNGMMVKFYMVQTVSKIPRSCDKDISPVYSRACADDHWEPV